MRKRICPRTECCHVAALKSSLLTQNLTLSPHHGCSYSLNSREAEAPRGQLSALRTKSEVTEAEDFRRCLGITSPTLGHSCLWAE